MASINVESEDSVPPQREHDSLSSYIQGDMSSAGRRNHSAVALPCLGFAFTMTIDCSASFWGTHISHGYLSFSQYIFYLMLLRLVYALNKWCHIPGRMCLINNVRLTNDMFLTVFGTCIPVSYNSFLPWTAPHTTWSTKSGKPWSRAEIWRTTIQLCELLIVTHICNYMMESFLLFSML